MYNYYKKTQRRGFEMFAQLNKRLFSTKQEDRFEVNRRIAALEEEIAELKAHLEVQNQTILVSDEEKGKTLSPTAPIKIKLSEQVKDTFSTKAAYFDMVEYFCNGHDDTAVDVIQYNSNGNEISRDTFSWNCGCGEVTSEGIWRKADGYADRLIQEGIVLRHRKSI